MAGRGTGENMIRVLVVDDHPVIRQGLRQILADSADIEVGGEASDGREALKLIRSEPWDVVLLDISMPGMNGLDLVKQLRVEKAALQILVLSIHPEDQYAIRMLRAGAAGYVTKGSPPDQLVAAIRKVAQGGNYISPEVSAKVLTTLIKTDNRPPHEILSDREFEVMRKLAAGTTVSAISKELILSVKTVSTYRTRILQKMRLKSNAELTRYALDNGLLH